MQSRPLQRSLERAPVWFLTIFAMATAFSTYFCMYAFRKPFSAASYEGMTFFGSDITINGKHLGFKTTLVISQIIGYAISKYMGIKFVSEMTRARRAVALVGFILVAEASLLLFAVVPNDFKMLALFINGLPLGMVWGLVVWYLEGRRTSELLLAGLSCSFILASGVVKDVGRALMDPGNIPEVWMPFVTGLIFLLPFLLSVWLINHLPEPSEADITARAEREPMDGRHRVGFVKAFLPGLIGLFVVYFFLTAYRDFRDNYGVEILTGLGYGERAGVFTQTEIWVAFGVMAVLAGLNLIKDNRRGLLGAFGVMAFGCVLMAGGTLAYDMKLIGGLTWMVCNGLGAYLTYVPFGSVLFDRMIASTRIAGTAVFAIYVADAIGYTGSIGVQLYKDFFAGDETRLSFFHTLTYAMAALGTVLLLCSAAYFARKTAKGPAKIDEAAEAPGLPFVHTERNPTA